MDDEVSALIESYYAVARDLQRQGERLLEMANTIGLFADRMSEQRIREKQKAEKKSS
jgi:hypothetical protein